NWNVAANWSRNGVPNNGANIYFVVIDGDRGTASAVSLNLFVVVSTLTIGGNDSLSIADAFSFQLSGGSHVNDGTILQNSTGNTTDFVLQADTTFSGAGTLTFSNSLANRLYTNSGLLRITNGPSHTMNGAAQLGLNQSRVTNQGMIDAN